MRDAAPGGDFAPGLSNAGGRVPTPIRDIPQSVNVINRAVMEAQGATSLADALRNVPGITIGAAEGGTIGNNFNLRGFSARTDLYLDGMRDRGQIYRDVFSLDAVEVLKGPSSMLFGRGSTGGVINQVSKLPSLTPHNEASVTLGTQPSLRITADLNQPLADTSAFRIAVMAQDVHSTRDVMENKDYGIAPSLRFGIGTPTEVTLSALLSHNNDMPDYGLPPVNGAPGAGGPPQLLRPDRRPHDPGRRPVHRQVDHKLDSETTLRNQTQYARLRDRRARIGAEQRRHRHGRRLHGLSRHQPGQHHHPAAVAAVRRARQPRPRHHRHFALQPDRPHHRIPDRLGAPRR